MKPIWMFLVLFLFVSILPIYAQTPTTARDYYKELYAAGGLDRFADMYACFFDDPKNDAFFIFSEGKVIREFMIMDGTFQKLPKEDQEIFNKDPLIFRGYAHGVPHDDNEIYAKEADSWVSEKVPLGDDKLMRVRFTINWQTLRFRRSVEWLGLDSHFIGEKPNFGRCEKIPSTVRQHGGSNSEQ